MGTGFVDGVGRLDNRYGTHIIIRNEAGSNEVIAETCPTTDVITEGDEAGDCEHPRITTIWEYAGEDGPSLARQSAANLFYVLQNEQLYGSARIQGRFWEDLYDERDITTWGNDIFVNNWASDLLPSWAQCGGRTILFLSSYNYPQDRVEESWATFLSNLWASGIMAPALMVAREDADILAAQLVFRFRDPRLRGLLELASLQMQQHQYEAAETTAQAIRDFELTVTTRRALFATEATFLRIDIERLRAMVQWSIGYFGGAMDLSYEDEGRLGSLELGYMARFNYERLKTCSLVTQVFPLQTWAGMEDCEPEDVDFYLQNATRVFNYRQPTYSDNYLALRAMLDTGEYYLAMADINRSYLDNAEEAFTRALALVELIEASSNVTGPDGNDTAADTEERWARYFPIMPDHNRWVASYVGHDWGLWWYEATLRAGRFARGDVFGLLYHFENWGGITDPLVDSNNFDPSKFLLYRGRAEEGLARVARRRADLLAPGRPNNLSEYNFQHEELEENLQVALAGFEQSYNTMGQLRRENIWQFYYPGMYEERSTYFQVAIGYAETLFALYSLREPEYNAYLAQAEELAVEVERQVFAERLDITHLRAAYLLSRIRVEQGWQQEEAGSAILAGRRYQEAIGLLVAIDEAINQEEQAIAADNNDHRIIPPLYQELRLAVRTRLPLIRARIANL